jgi:hypothetical protein
MDHGGSIVLVVQELRKEIEAHAMAIQEVKP